MQKCNRSSGTKARLSFRFSPITSGPIEKMSLESPKSSEEAMIGMDSEPLREVVAENGLRAEANFSPL